MQAAQGSRTSTGAVVAPVMAVATAALAALCGLAQAAGAPSLPAPVYRTVAVAAGGKVYVLGGHDLTGASVTSVEVFDPAHRVARLAGSLVYATHGAAAANLRGRILVFGGASTSVHAISVIGPTIYLLGGIACAPLAAILPVQPH